MIIPVGYTIKWPAKCKDLMPIFLVIDQYISSPCNWKADFIVYLQALKSNWFDNYFILIMWILMGKK